MVKFSDKNHILTEHKIDKLKCNKTLKMFTAQVIHEIYIYFRLGRYSQIFALNPAVQRSRLLLGLSFKIFIDLKRKAFCNERKNYSQTSKSAKFLTRALQNRIKSAPSKGRIRDVDGGTFSAKCQS